MNYYLIYGLKRDITHFEEFDDYLFLKSYLEIFIIDEYKDDYKIIKGNEIKEVNKE